MKILVPITNSNEIEVFNPDIYNTEFFCGYLPEWWLNQFNESNQTTNVLSTPINNRNAKSANVLEFDELKRIVNLADKYTTDVFCVLNAKYYPDYVYSYIKRYIDELVSAGIKKLIVSDLGMISFLCENYSNIKISVSCLNQITNSKAVEFYSKFSNVERIVFPRHMDSCEIKEIVSAYPNIDFEYFIFSNKCLYDDGYCRGIHEFTPICKDIFFSEYYHRDNKILDSSIVKKFRINEFEFNEWTRNEILTKQQGICTASFGCLACSLPKLIDKKNIVSLKMSIRGHGIEERLQQVKMASEIIRCVENGQGEDVIKEIVSKLYGKENVCESGNACIMN